MTQLAAQLLALLSLLVAPQAINASKDGVLDFERLANAFALDKQLTGIAEKSVSFPSVLNTSYAHLELGLFDVYHPVDALRDPKNATSFKRVCHGLLDLQEHWLAMLEPASSPHDQAFKALDKWIASWNLSQLSKLDQSTDLDLFVTLRASPKCLQAAQSLRVTMLKGAALGLDRQAADSSPLVLCPTRYEFTRLVCYAGLTLEGLRSSFWTENLQTWLECRINNTRVLALEYIDPEHPLDIQRGLPMNLRRQDELEQHVIQRAFLSLIQNYFGDRMDPALAVGLAINVNIDLFGSDHTRLEGDPRGAATPPREVFIPGGQSYGGTLPPLDANSPWRISEGEFRFIKELVRSQKSGSKSKQTASQRSRSFQILSDDGDQPMVVMAPFLGRPAYSKPAPPQKYIGDYQEFFRAYRTAFAHWLRSAAGKDSRDSKARYAELLVQLAASHAADDERTFEAIVNTVFALPLSSSEPSKEDLEGRFLAWLMRQ